jgi:O-antigen/teichoic acid export membrane protein
LMSAIFPKISELSYENKIGGIRGVLNRVSHLPLLIIIPGIFGGEALKRQLLAIVFGQEFVTGATVLMILLLGKLVQSYHVTLARTLSAMDLPQLTMASRLVSIPTNIVLNIILIPIWGLQGAAVASVIAMGVNLFLNYRYLLRYFSISSSWHEILWIIFSSTVMYALIWAFKITIDISGYLSLGLALLLGCCTYFAVLVMSSNVRTTLQSFIQMDIS